MERIIQRGAEAVLIKRGDDVVKRRVKKGYRLDEIDGKLRRARTKCEARLLEKSGKLVKTPIVKRVSEFEIEMEFIDGLKLSDNLDTINNWEEVCFSIGQGIAKLHDAGIIHGDLTTSNLIWVPAGKLSHQLSAKPRGVSVNGGAKQSDGKLFFIDFGLGFSSKRVEDKAVDLHLIRQALEAKHFSRWEKFFATVLGGYKLSENFAEVMKRFEKVERRGRYKTQD